MTLLGPSGCGKSTLLKSVSGLLETDGGDVLIDGASVIKLPAEKRGAVIVFQDLRLFPHLSVEGNIEFPMKLQGVPKARREARVKSLLEMVRLPGMEKRRMSQLSGGQMQRVALARALAARPRMLLLDEPFSSLDEELRSEMDDFVKELHRRSDITIVMVTHDKREALSISDRIALMIDGRIVQVDTPEEMYMHPANKGVSDYWGGCCYLSGRVESGTFVSPAINIPVHGCCDGGWILCVRPNAVRLLRHGEWEVVNMRYQGESSLITLRLRGIELTARTREPVRPGDMLGVELDPNELVCFPGEQGSCT